MKRGATILAAVLIAFIVLSVATRHSRPVLVRLPWKTNFLEGSANYALFNPFRDRLPERVAAAYLDAMRRGNCSEAFTVAANPTMSNDLTCEQLEQEYSRDRNLFVQPLRDRRDAGGDVFLYYSRTGYEGNWIAVRNTAGEWRVVGFNKIR